jgi:two-component system chemotaxis response regulator CheY
MKEIIKWLREIEHLANHVYLEAAAIYADDIKLKKFLDHIAEDEAWHYHVMGSAAEYLLSIPDVNPVISIDSQTRNKITGLFKNIEDGLRQNTLSRDELIDKIAEVELSEWNDIFHYTVNFLKERTSEFKYPAARIQAHIKEIEYYLEKTEGRPKALQKIKELPPVWIENILIVDDEEMITDLIKALLNRSGNIDISHNGQDAFELMERKYYKLVISDIDMPIMDGLTFYKTAVEKFPASSKKFLFMTGDLSPEREAFFKKNMVKYLSKPMDINVMRDVAAKIIIS